MAERRVRRKELWKQLPKIKKKKDWINAGVKLGLKVTQSKGGSSHYALRYPNYENWDIRGLVATIFDPVRKDMSESIFKQLLDKGYQEDDIWKALGWLKNDST